MVIVMKPPLTDFSDKEKTRNKVACVLNCTQLYFANQYSLQTTCRQK